MLAENPPLGGASEVSSAPFARIQSRPNGTPGDVPFGCTNPAARDGDGVVFPTDVDSGAGRVDGARLQLEGLVAVEAAADGVEPVVLDGDESFEL